MQPSSPTAQSRGRTNADPRNDPGLVWHYTDGHGLISILRNHVLWATASAFLNDREEVSLGVRAMKRRFVQRAEEGDEIAAAVIERLAHVNLVEGPSAGKFFILSASRSADSLAMWRCYGRAPEAYAIGLDASSPLLVLGDATAHPDVDAVDDGFVLRHRTWAPVVYEPDAQGRLVDTALDRVTQALAALGVRDAPGPRTLESLTEEHGGLLDDLEECLLLMKHHGFREEQETRHSTVLYSSAGADTTGFVRYRTGAFGISPFVHLTGPDTSRPARVGTNRPRPLPIRALAIGPSPNGDAANHSVAELLRDCGYPDVPVLRSQIPYRS